MKFKFHTLVASLNEDEREELFKDMRGTFPSFSSLSGISSQVSDDLFINFTTPYEMKGKTITTHLKFSHFSKGGV